MWFDTAGFRTPSLRFSRKDEPMQPFIDLFTQLQANLLTIAPIVAVCGVALWFLMNALAPVIPDWGQAARGYLQRILIGAIIVGAATTLVTAFMALGGG